MKYHTVSLPNSDFDFHFEDCSGVEASGLPALVLKANKIKLYAYVKPEVFNNIKRKLNANIHIKDYKARRLISIEGLRFICVVVRIKVFPNDGSKPYTTCVLPEFIAPRHQHCALNLATAQFLSTKDNIPELDSNLDSQITETDLQRLLNVFFPEADSVEDLERMLLMEKLPGFVVSGIKPLAAKINELLALNGRRGKYFIRRKPFMLRALTELNDGFLYKPGTSLRPAAVSSGAEHPQWFAKLFLFFYPQTSDTPIRLNLSSFYPHGLSWPRGVAP